MAVGQVGFKDQKKVDPRIRSAHPLTARQVKRIHVAQRENPIVNRLNKTREEKQPDLQQERLDRAKELRGREQAARHARQKEEARVARERKEKAWQRDHAYDDLFTAESVAAASNEDVDPNYEEDFM